MYREIAQQKKEKAEREKVNAPKERDYEAEHARAVAETRKKEEESGERSVSMKQQLFLNTQPIVYQKGSVTVHSDFVD